MTGLDWVLAFDAITSHPNKSPIAVIKPDGRRHCIIGSIRVKKHREGILRAGAFFVSHEDGRRQSTPFLFLARNKVRGFGTRGA